MADVDYRVVYVTTEGVGSTVFDSQVRKLADRLTSSGIPTRLLILQPWMRLLRPRTFRAFLSAVLMGSRRGSTIRLVQDFASRSQLRSFAASFADRAASSLGFGAVIFHCRGPEASLIGLELSKRRQSLSKVVFDVRGLACEEFAAAPLRASYLAEIEREVMRDVDAFSFVSTQLRDTYASRYGMGQKPSAINLASYDDQAFSYDTSARQATRQRMRWSNETVFVYAGGTQEYQSLPRVLQAFRQLSSSTRNGHLLLLTARPIPRLKRELASTGIEQSEVSYIRGVPHDAMPGYLSASDWGLVFRRPGPINNVATPTKIAEYLGCGLPVILGGRTALYPELIESHPILGTVVPYSGDLESIVVSRRSDDVRKQVAAFAKAHLSMSITTEGYKGLYGALLR